MNCVTNWRPRRGPAARGGGVAIVRWLALAALVVCVVLALAPACEARGGRGRGGGTLGGIFGGWRKYKKPANGGNSRRYNNGAPAAPAVSKPASSGHAHGGASLKDHHSKHTLSQTHSAHHASYPRQQAPFGGAASGQQYMPPGSTYYASTAAMPPGAVYYAQAPMRSSGGGGGDFLMGMMTGHMLNQMMYGPRLHGSHVYRQQQPQPQPDSADGARVIIINNGEATGAATGAAEGVTPTLWPTDAVVPLAPYNASMTAAEAMQPTHGVAPVFAHGHANPPSTANAASGHDAAAHPAPYGIVCVPMLFNETDPMDLSRTLTVEKIVCYPAPPPQPPTTAVPGKGCYTLVEPDPVDPTKAIELQIKDCKESTEPVAGDIGDTTAEPAVQLATTLPNVGVGVDPV